MLWFTTPPEMVILAVPLLTFVTVRVIPSAASSGEMVAGETVTIPVLLDVTLTLVAKSEICTFSVFVPVQVSVFVTAVPINTSGVAGA